jgi:CRISPR-associated endonuclease Cas1
VCRIRPRRRRHAPIDRKNHTPLALDALPETTLSANATDAVFTIDAADVLLFAPGVSVKSSNSSLAVSSIASHVFCPRLFWLEEVADEWSATSGDDAPPDADDVAADASTSDETDATAPPDWHTRSLKIADDELGLVAEIDVVELDAPGGGESPPPVAPVTYASGSPADDGHLRAPDRVALTLQALLLRRRGYDCHRVAAWYAGSQDRIERRVTAAMIEEAERAVERALEVMSQTERPPEPLEDSPKCSNCSLRAICQPDEVHALDDDHLADVATFDFHEAQGIDDVQPPRDDALPVYAHTQGAYVRKHGRSLLIEPPDSSDETVEKVGMGRVEQLNLMGSIQVTTQAMQACLRTNTPVCYFSSSGWFYGLAHPISRPQVHRRTAQHDAHGTHEALEIARTIVADKIYNARVLLRRNADALPDGTLDRLARLYDDAESADDSDALLGLEGRAGRLYWQGFDALVSSVHDAFEMDGRNRRPPEDPVNALLSYGYALLIKDCKLAIDGVGLDTYMGLFHAPGRGKPALALDLMEVFRPLVVDSVVLRLVRRGDVQPDDFVGAEQAVAMEKPAKRALVREYERRMETTVTHPVFGYDISYRRILHVQARLLARVLTGEIDAFPHFRTR